MRDLDRTIVLVILGGFVVGETMRGATNAHRFGIDVGLSAGASAALALFMLVFGLVATLRFSWLAWRAIFR